MTRPLCILLALFVSISLWNESECAETAAETLAKLLKSESELHQKANKFQAIVGDTDERCHQSADELIDEMTKNLHDCKGRYALAEADWIAMVNHNQPTAHNFSYTEQFKAMMSKALPTNCPEKLLWFVRRCKKVDYEIMDKTQFQLLELIAASNLTTRYIGIDAFLDCAKRGECMSRDYVDRIKALLYKPAIDQVGSDSEHAFTPLLTNRKSFRLVNTLTGEYLICDGTLTKDMFNREICDFTVRTFFRKTGYYKLRMMTGGTLSVHSEANPIRNITIVPEDRFSDGQGWTFQLDNDGHTFHVKNRFYDEILVTKDGQAYTTKAVEGSKQTVWEARYKPAVFRLQ